MALLRATPLGHFLPVPNGDRTFAEPQLFCHHDRQRHGDFSSVDVVEQSALHRSGEPGIAERC